MSALEPSLGSLIGGKYRLEAVIGRGGMGVVFRAAHVRSGRLVALKWLLVDDQDTRERFVREARALGALSHPNVVGILDLGTHQGRDFLVMEYIEGKSLRSYMHEKKKVLSLRDAIELLLPAISGIAAAHRAGLVHRDIKPDNLFVCLDRDGSAYDLKVLDFGVVRRVVRAEDEYATMHGYCVGTPRYMAPEQFRADPDVDARADVYSLGVVLHELVTGTSPRKAQSSDSMAASDGSDEIPTIRARSADVPAELVRVLDRMLAWDRDSRYADATELGRALEKLAPGLRFIVPRDVHVSLGASSTELDALTASIVEEVVDPSAVRLAEMKTPPPAGRFGLRIHDGRTDGPDEDRRAPRRRIATLAAVAVVSMVVGIGFVVGVAGVRALSAPQVAPAAPQVQRIETHEIRTVVVPPTDSTATTAEPAAPAAPTAQGSRTAGTAGQRPRATPRVVHGRSGTLRANEF